MDNNLRHNKTDKVDAYRLALIQFNAPQRLQNLNPGNIMNFKMLVGITKSSLKQ